MADASVQPPKEKTKKKKSDSKKSEQAKKLPATESATEGVESVEKPASRKPSATPETEALEKSSEKPSATPEKEVIEKVETSETEVPTDNVEEIQQPVPETSSAANAPEPYVPPELEEPLSTYKPPPAATKRDVELLEDLDEAKLKELQEAFELFDLNHDGVIDLEDLRSTYMTLGKKPEEVDENEIQHMISEAINPLDFDAFVVLLGYKTIELDPEEILREALSKWDYDNSGLISEERIKHDLMTWGDRFTPEEVEVALEDAPTFVGKREVMIDYVKFCKILCGLRKKTKEPAAEDFMKN